MGCGTMGGEVADAVASGVVRNARIVAVHDPDRPRSLAVAGHLNPRPRICENMDDLLAIQEVELVVECASQDAVKAHGVAILAASRHLLMISSGALVDTDLFTTMAETAVKNGRQLIVPSGALGGIDAIRAARDQLDEVTLVSTKRPAAFAGAPGFSRWDGVEITGPRIIFEGSVPEAVALFPANVNVAATVSLAGLGTERTKVRVIADPDAPGNVHEVEARGRCGEYSFRLVNSPNVRNPKTSHLAVLSAIEALRTFCEPGPRFGT
jgi:aspartate dehydrogenase